jgi:hypothetical protein
MPRTTTDPDWTALQATAFVHRDARLLLKHAVVVDADCSAAEREAARRWLDASWAAVHPWGSGGAYQNFPGPSLEDWAHAYYGPTSTVCEGSSGATTLRTSSGRVNRSSRRLVAGR